MSSRIRLLYLTYNENILESGILYTQVRRMLELMRQQENIEQIRLISFISPRLWFRRRKGYIQLKQELSDSGIDFRLYWMFVAQSWLFWSVPICLLTSLPILLCHVLVGRFDVVHARGYMASLLSFLATKIRGSQFIFDTRGEYPEEMAMNGRWPTSGMTFRMWKFIEQYMVRYSDAVIGVTPTFKQRYISEGAKRSLFVPNRCEVDRFGVDSTNNSLYEEPTLLFTGEMSSTWNHPKRVAKSFLLLKKHISALKLKLITQRNPEFVHGELKNSIRRSDYSLESSLPAEIPQRIVGSSIGLVLAIRHTGNWPVKFAEYLSAGLPVVVDCQVGEQITVPVIKYRLGIVIDENDPNTYKAISDVIAHRSEYSTRCLRYARMKLDLSHTVRQYIRLYRQLIGERSVS